MKNSLGFGILLNFFKYSFVLSILLIGLVCQTSSSHAVMGQLASEVSEWAKSHGFTVAGEATTGTSGCLKGKRYVPLQSGSIKAFATFYHPGYQEETGSVTQMIFEFDPPVSVAQARSYGIKVAPIAGTRGPTHKQKIKADANNACIGASGGVEERYTDDFIFEYLYGSGDRVKRLRVYNDYIR